MNLIDINSNIPSSNSSPASAVRAEPILLSTNTYRLSEPGGPSKSRAGVDASTLAFPRSSIVGSIGELASVLSEGNEAPIEFYFACGLTLLGAYTCGQLKLNIGFDVDTRLYTILLGKSYSVKKSTAMKTTVKFFAGLGRHQAPSIIHGVGSGEGLARNLTDNPHGLIAYDELRGLIDKCTVTGSSLLSMITSLFEQNDWENATKNKRQSFKVNNAHVSLLACCTYDTYQQIWNREAIAIGLPNRLFVVGADAKPKVAWPLKPDPDRLAELATRIHRQLNHLPLTLDITPEGRNVWEEWYKQLPSNTPHAGRLDTIGFRLLALLALATDKKVIDAETVQQVVDILKYEFDYRTLTDPIDADSNIAKLEENIRRHLRRAGHSGLTERELKQKVNANKVGIWAFDQAVKNLISAGEIERNQKLYRWKEEPAEEAAA